MLVQAGTEMALGSDPDLRYTPSGAAVCEVRAVTSRRRKNKQTDDWEDVDTTWYTLTMWNQLAENAAESLAKGMRVIVVGKVVNEEWENKEGGKSYRLKIMVDAIGPSLTFATAKVQKVDRSGSSGGTGGGSSAPPAEDPWATGPAQTDEPPF